MDEKTIRTIIRSLGFPIVCCLGLGWWIKTITENFTKQLEETRKDHKEEIKSLKDSLDNNTIAITKLLDQMEK